MSGSVKARRGSIYLQSVIDGADTASWGRKYNRRRIDRRGVVNIPVQDRAVSHTEIHLAAIGTHVAQLQIPGDCHDVDVVLGGGVEQVRVDSNRIVAGPDGASRGAERQLGRFHKR